MLLVLDGRIIDLGDGGAGFASRVMALVDEFDNKKRVGHVQRGILAKLDGGKAVTGPPTGYISIKDKDNNRRWKFDPDPAVQSAIATIFRVFPDERSCARTVRRLLAEGMKIPARKPGRSLYWVTATIGGVRRIITNALLLRRLLLPPADR